MITTLLSTALAASCGATPKGCDCLKMSEAEWFVELVNNRYLEPGTCFQYSALVSGSTSGTEQRTLQMMGQSSLDMNTRGYGAGRAYWIWSADLIKWPDGVVWEEHDIDPIDYEENQVVPGTNVNTWTVLTPMGDVMANLFNPNPNSAPKTTLVFDDDEDGEDELVVIWTDGTTWRVDPYQPGQLIQPPPPPPPPPPGN